MAYRCPQVGENLFGLPKSDAMREDGAQKPTMISSLIATKGLTRDWKLYCMLYCMLWTERFTVCVCLFLEALRILHFDLGHERVSKYRRKSGRLRSLTFQFQEGKK